MESYLYKIGPRGKDLHIPAFRVRLAFLPDVLNFSFFKEGLAAQLEGVQSSDSLKASATTGFVSAAKSCLA